MSKSILIVDDEDDVRLFLEDFLKDRNMDVVTAGSGKKALEAMEKKPADLVLLDIMMPGMDGLECLEHIKKQYPQTKVVMVTALKDESRIARARELGAIDYIMKPFSLSFLESELTRFINL